MSWPERTVLGALTNNSREALLSVGTLRQYPVGCRIIMEGDTSTYVVVLIDGWAKVVGASEEGGQALLALRSRGDLVGELAALDDQPRTASVISAGSVVGLEIRQGEFLRLLAEHQDLSIAVTRALSAKLRWSTRRLIEFSGLSVGVRLVRVLSELASLDSQRTTDGIELGFGLSQPELAAMVGASEPSVQRALHQLREKGVVETGYRRVIITDPLALEAIGSPVQVGSRSSANPSHEVVSVPSPRGP